MFRSRTRPFNACTGNGKHKNHEIKNLFKESLLRPDCRINPVVGDGDKPEDKKKPKKFRVIPLHKTITVVSSAEIHARKERQRIKREVLYTPKELPPLPVVKQKTRTAPKKYELVKGLNAIKEIKVEKKVPHWEVFPSVVKHEVRSSEEDLSDTEIEELEKLILPLYPFQCNLPPLKKTEVHLETSSKTTEDATTSNEKNESESSSTPDKTEIKEENEKLKQEKEEKVVSTEIKDEPQKTCEKEEKKINSKKTPKKNATKGKTKKKEKLPSSNEEKTKVESADRVLTRTAKSKLLKNVNVKEEKEAQEPEEIQNTGRITRSKAKNQTAKKTVEPKVEKKKKEKKKEKTTTGKGKIPTSKGKVPAVKGKVQVDNGVARGRSVKKKIKINFHDKKSLKHFKDFSLTIETD